MLIQVADETKKESPVNSIAVSEQGALSVFDDEHLARIENLCQANNLTRDEFELFLFTAKQRRLDPLKNQVCAVKRWSGKDRREVMTVQTTIDGFRVIASRTGKLAGMSDVTYAYNDDGTVFSASITVYRLTAGERCPYTATAFFDEYCARTKNGQPTRFWSKMGRHMIGKCAEALCLRKAFPEELSGLYTSDEMDQADNDRHSAPSRPAVVKSPPGPSEVRRQEPRRIEQKPVQRQQERPKPIHQEPAVKQARAILSEGGASPARESQAPADKGEEPVDISALIEELSSLNQGDGEQAKDLYKRATDADKEEKLRAWLVRRIKGRKSGR